MELRRVCVYAASSTSCAQVFQDAARHFGRLLAEERISVVYGGGAVGLMGALANGALEAGGEVVGIIPGFMVEREWGHDGATRLEIVPDMHTRKRMMIEQADAIVALPGGCGTLEELLEAITWKRLGLHGKPIVVADLDHFYRPLLAQLDACIHGRFMSDVHGEMWRAVTEVAEILPSLRAQRSWGPDALDFAAV